jgi:hypothetical protein
MAPNAVRTSISTTVVLVYPVIRHMPRTDPVVIVG